MKYENYIKLEFPSKSCNEALARSVAGVFASQIDPTMEELGDIKTAVSEAVTNCIVHAYPDCIGKILMRCRILEDNRHPRLGPRHRRCRQGEKAVVYDRRRGTQRYGLHDHGELYG